MESVPDPFVRWVFYPPVVFILKTLWLTLSVTAILRPCLVIVYKFIAQKGYTLYTKRKHTLLDLLSTQSVVDLRSVMRVSNIHSDVLCQIWRSNKTITPWSKVYTFSLGCYLDECPFDALSQVDPCTWTSDWQSPSQVPSSTDHLVKCHPSKVYQISDFHERHLAKWRTLALSQVVSRTEHMNKWLSPPPSQVVSWTGYQDMSTGEWIWSFLWAKLVCVWPLFIAMWKIHTYHRPHRAFLRYNPC